jgi:uncharacterized repeat protein (TIGR04138 family)
MNPKGDILKAVRDIVAKDPRYRVDAYLFVSDAVTHTSRKLAARKGARKHISGQELLDGIRELALDRFGPLALEVLSEWGVRRTEDFGSIVFNLVANGLLGASEEDSAQDFAGGYDFQEAFVKPFIEAGPPPKDLPKIA